SSLKLHAHLPQLSPPSPPHRTRHPTPSSQKSSPNAASPTRTQATSSFARMPSPFATPQSTSPASAAYILTRDEQYARRAGAHLRAWFVTENTRMLPTGDLAGREYGSETGTPNGINDLAPLAELIRSTS